MSDLCDLIPKTKRKLKPLAVAPPPTPDPIAPPREEFVVQPNGQVRQAGATQPEDNFVSRFRKAAQGDLYIFVKSVLGRAYLTPEIHLPLCRFLQTTPPRRKMAEIFRGGAKTSIVSHGLPLHVHIQDRETNCYFPGEDGRSQRGLLIGETLAREQDAMMVISSACETNQLLRAFWPEHFWENPRKQSKKWNSSEILLPRSRADEEWPDPTFRAIGCGQAIVGAHPSYFIKDDLVTEAAANSPLIMQTAIDWHIQSRAMLARVTDLEFIIGTRWAIYDLYSFIEEHDPSMEIFKRALVEEDTEGKEYITYPRFTAADGMEYGYVWAGDEKSIEYLKKDNGPLYPLLYLNKADDPTLVDFSADQLRHYTLTAGNLHFDEDDRDIRLAELKSMAKQNFPRATFQGQKLTPTVMQEMFARRNEHIRLVS